MAVDEERWLGRLLAASQAALSRLRNPELDVDPCVVDDLEAFSLEIQTRLEELRRRSGTAS